MGRPLAAQDVFGIIRDQEIRFVDLKFVDLFGRLQHITFAVEAFDLKAFRDGLGFDGSSVRGFQAIHESDMLMVPDPSSAFVDPFFDDPTLSLFCDILDPRTHTFYSRGTRGVARRAEQYLLTTGIADTAFFGPELEFFVFEDVRFDQHTKHSFYFVDSDMAFWNRGGEQGPNLGHKMPQKQAYFVCPPSDGYHNLRSKMISVLRAVGIDAELHHHEVASAGQQELGFKFGTLVQQADSSLKYKYVIKNVAHRYGKTATFMPKPLFEENGSGMHVHCSLWKEGQNTFYEPGGYADLSDNARYFIGGLLAHAPALCGLTNPTTNSYRRLVPGYEAPINLAFSASNRSACVRIPAFANTPNSKRIEFRTPDPTANPYLAFAAILMAGLDGIQRKIDPPSPIDVDIYELSEDEKKDIGSAPGSLEEALDALERDHDFLLEGGVFTEDLISTWVAHKRKHEIDYIRLRPHPGEFSLYYDA
ncbi:MAG TPA: type I glutamate--ammonia ligase [Planctomycetes bacterium]|nr:type I glutamate--ammonia ligase [Planctomycetota bacterium]